MEVAIDQSIYLNQFEVVFPQHAADQNEICEWVCQNHIQSEQLKGTGNETQVNSDLIARLFKKYAVKSEQISKRYFECGDILNRDTRSASIYNLTNSRPSGADIATRAQFFSEQANRVFHILYQKKINRPNHLIHVTCTGYVSPSAAQRIVVAPFWKRNQNESQATAVTHAYHMGCYAALPAIRMAEGFVQAAKNKQKDFQVDIIHNELCGLHMNPQAQNPEQIIVQTLFADGHIKYAATSSASEKRNFKVLAIHEKIIADSEKDMSWTPASWGLQMTLSREVPQKIKQHVRLFLQELLMTVNIPLDEMKNAKFAIHPGGPKIIDAVQEALELSDKQTQESKKILFERGNMSSATLPHVWNEMLNSDIPQGTKIISLAFGPGLTLFGSVFELV